MRIATKDIIISCIGGSTAGLIVGIFLEFVFCLI